MTRWNAVGAGVVVGFLLAVVLPDALGLTRLAWAVGGFVAGALAGGSALRGAWHGLLPTAVMGAFVVALGTLYLAIYGSGTVLLEWYAAFLPALPGILLAFAVAAAGGALGAVVAGVHADRVADAR